MKRIALAIAVGMALLVTAGVAKADPVNSPNTLALTAVCSNGHSYTFLVTPSAGRAVLDTGSHAVQITFGLTVNDPLNEIGGSFSFPVSQGIPPNRLIACTGTVIGTQAVTYTAQVLLTPQGP